MRCSTRCWRPSRRRETGFDSKRRPSALAQAAFGGAAGPRAASSVGKRSHAGHDEFEHALQLSLEPLLIFGPPFAILELYIALHVHSWLCSSRGRPPFVLLLGLAFDLVLRFVQPFKIMWICSEYVAKSTRRMPSAEKTAPTQYLESPVLYRMYESACGCGHRMSLSESIRSRNSLQKSSCNCRFGDRPPSCSSRIVFSQSLGWTTTLNCGAGRDWSILNSLTSIPK